MARQALGAPVKSSKRRMIYGTSRTSSPSILKSKSVRWSPRSETIPPCINNASSGKMKTGKACSSMPRARSLPMSTQKGQAHRATRLLKLL
eukprot:scaffold123056_cov21-Prasinocladus_malaysianus.AAC.1